MICVVRFPFVRIDLDRWWSIPITSGNGGSGVVPSLMMLRENSIYDWTHFLRRNHRDLVIKFRSPNISLENTCPGCWWIVASMYIQLRHFSCISVEETTPMTFRIVALYPTSLMFMKMKTEKEWTKNNKKKELLILFFKKYMYIDGAMGSSIYFRILLVKNSTVKNTF